MVNDLLKVYKRDNFKSEALVAAYVGKKKNLKILKNFKKQNIIIRYSIKSRWQETPPLSGK